MFEAILPDDTKDLLQRLTPKQLPKDTYLAGGTAIALHMGHRRSQDIDLFTPFQFNENLWEQKFAIELNFRITQKDWQTLVGTAQKTKISLMFYKYKMIGKTEKVYSLPTAPLPDLAAMKLETIISRGTKRDFIDIYFLAQKFGLVKMLSFYQQKYGTLEEKELMLKKGLLYFEKADKEEMPYMLVPTDWKKVKSWLMSEVRKLS